MSVYRTIGPLVCNWYINAISLKKVQYNTGACMHARSYYGDLEEHHKHLLK